MQSENRKIASTDTMPIDAFGLLILGIVAIPAGTMFLFLNLGDPKAIDALPKLYGLAYLAAGLSPMVVATTIFVLLFPKIARLLWTSAYRITLHEDGLSISRHKGDETFYSYEEFDKVSIKQSEDLIFLEFFKGENNWRFSLEKRGNRNKFSKAIRLVDKLGDYQNSRFDELILET